MPSNLQACLKGEQLERCFIGSSLPCYQWYTSNEAEAIYEYVAVVEHPGAQRLNTRGAEIVQLRRQGCTLTA